MAGPNETTGEASAPKGKTSLVGVIIEIVAVSVIAAGAGAGLGFVRGPPATVAAPAPDKVATGPERALLELPPIVTNIAAPTDLWIRIEAAVVLDGKPAQPPDVLAAEIATDALAYLRTLTIGQIEGPIGLANIRQDLTDRAVVRSNGKVSELILKTLVLQ